MTNIQAIANILITVTELTQFASELSMRNSEDEVTPEEKEALKINLKKANDLWESA